MQSPNGKALETTLGSRAVDSQTPTDAGEGDFGGGEGGFGDEDGDGKYSEPDSGTVGDFDQSAPSTVNPREPHAHVDGEAVAYSVGQDIVSETQPQFPDVNACTSQGDLHQRYMRDRPPPHSNVDYRGQGRVMQPQLEYYTPPIQTKMALASWHLGVVWESPRCPILLIRVVDREHVVFLVSMY